MVAGMMSAIPMLAQAQDVPTSVNTAGDSISYGIASGGRFLNGGIVGSGITHGDVLGNERHWRLASVGSSMTIVEIGTNDFAYRDVGNYPHLLDRYILPLNDPRKLCIVSIPLSERADLRQGEERLNPVIRKWAAERKLHYVDFPEFDPKTDHARDGIHFTMSAYRRFAKELKEKCLSGE